MNNRFLSLLTLAFALTALSYGWFSCGPSKVVDFTLNISKDPNVFSDEDRLAAKHVNDLYFKQGEHFEYNFADPLQYRHFKKQMYRAGINEENRPQFFKMLEQARTEHLQKYKPDQILLALPPSTNGNDDDTITGGIRVITSFSSTNPTFFTTSGLLSFPQDSLLTATTSIAMYQQNGNPVGASQQVSGYTPAQLADLEVATNGANPNVNDTVVSHYTYYYVTNDNQQHFGFRLAATANVVKAIVPLAPVPCVLGTSVQGCPCTPPPDPSQIGPCNGPLVQCTNNTLVTVCMTRHGPNCTYCNLGYANALMFPVVGYSVYSDTIRTDGHGKPQNASYSMTVTRLPSGGGCPAIPVGGSLLPYLTVHGDTLFWNMTQAQFNNNCIQSGDSVLFQMYIQVNIGASSQPAFITLTNAYNARPPAVKLAPIIVVSGCLAAGTLVEMSDGKKTKIEEVNMLSKVKTTTVGNPMTVDYNLNGFEADPCIRLVDNKGHSVVMTNGHPVVTPQGVVLARNLKSGDQVMTDQGVATLVEVSKVQYAGKVWNLSVGTPADSVPITKTNTTFFANGFLVGDHKMQQNFMYNLERSEEETLTRLPKEWHQDYLNSKKK